MSYIISYDLGTTGNKATLFKNDGKLLASVFHPYETNYFNINWVEQDPNDWYESVKISTQKLFKLSKINSDDVKVISFSGQMMGIVPIDRNGNPLRPAIIWADQRSITQADRLKKLGDEKVYSITGSRITPTYAGPKISWIKDNEPDVYSNAFKFLFAKDFIIYKLTGIAGTDFSDASLSLIFDIRKKQWSAELAEILNIDIGKLPEVSASTSIVGTVIPSVASELGLSEKTLVVRGAGDGSAATIGAGVFDSCEAYVYLGSSSWISTCASEPFFDSKARTFNFCYPIPDFYCPTGTMQSGGGSYQWAKNALCQFEEKLAKELNLNVYSIMDDLVDSTNPGAKGLIFLPYLVGERSPHWNVNAKGAFIGLSVTHNKNDMLRAVLEGVSFNLKMILDVFEKSGGYNFKKIRLIGGGAKGRNWRQIIADVFQKPIAVAKFPEEATSIGAAIIGGIGTKIITINDAKNFVKDLCLVEPRSMYFKRYEKMYEVFQKSYYSLLESFDLLAKID